MLRGKEIRFRLVQAVVQLVKMEEFEPLRNNIKVEANRLAGCDVITVPGLKEIHIEIRCSSFGEQAYTIGVKDLIPQPQTVDAP